MDYGSPNARRRCYFIGVREDVYNKEKFDAMVHFIQNRCPRIHARMSLNDCFSTENKCFEPPSLSHSSFPMSFFQAKTVKTLDSRLLTLLTTVTLVVSRES